MIYASNFLNLKQRIRVTEISTFLIIQLKYVVEYVGIFRSSDSVASTFISR